MARMTTRALIVGTLVGMLAACGSDAAPTASGSAAASGKASVHASSSAHSASAKVKPSASVTAPPTPSGPVGSSVAAVASSAAAATVPEPNKTELTLETAKGKVVFHSIHHGTVLLEAGGVVLWIDPYSEGDEVSGKPQADFVLITDIHPDHLDEKALDIMKKKEAVVMGPQAVADKLPGTQVIANGEKKQLGPFEVEAIPMYNLKNGPEPGKLFHDKGRGNGYVVSFGGKRIYFSGDTECIPEMKALKDIEVAFVCMNLPFTMTPLEAGECVAAFKPKTLVPYHYRGQDPDTIKPKLDGTGVTLERLRFY